MQAGHGLSLILARRQHGNSHKLFRNLPGWGVILDGAVPGCPPEYETIIEAGFQRFASACSAFFFFGGNN